jgi:3-hydroxyacyl-[acyl-carrier-protein] dehydratase
MFSQLCCSCLILRTVVSCFHYEVIAIMIPPELEGSGNGHPLFAVPLRAVDELRVQSCEGGLTLRAMKMVDANDPYLQGHFPDVTIFPGVFLIECLRQAVAWAVGRSMGGCPDIKVLHSVRFLAPLVPGDQIILDAIVGQILPGKNFDVDAHFRRSDGVTAARLKVEFGCGDDKRP